MTFKRDYKFGIQNEEKIFERLKKIDTDVKKASYKYNVVDFYSDMYLYELKTRNYRLNSFDKTIVGFNKIKYADEINKPLIILFNFTDGCYYYKHYKYSKNRIEVEKFCRPKREDHNDKPADYAYIQVKDLKPLYLLKNELY